VGKSVVYPTISTSIGGQVVPPEADAEQEQGYVDQAMRNLRATSRSAAGVLDLSSTESKEEKMVEGLTPQAAAGAVNELLNPLRP
jgi:hypothetical protein